MYIFKNAKVLTVTNDKIENLQVEVENDIIVYVGKERETKGEIIDCKSKLLMPGLVNAHAHSAMVFLRGFCNDLTHNDEQNNKNTMLDWLGQVQEKEKELTEQDIYKYTKIACKQYIRNGITTVCDMYFEPKSILKAFNEEGLRCKVALGAKLNTQNSLYEQLNKEYCSVKENSVGYVHAIYDVDEVGISDTLKFCKEKDLLLTMHLSESLQGVGECDKEYQMTPVAFCEKLGCFDRPCLAAHCVHLDKNDFDILANNQVNVVTCPSSNSNLASGIAPIYALSKRGVNICLGTDGASSSGILDIFREMHLVNILQKLYVGENKLFFPIDIIKMATINGAKALGYDNIGLIKKGYKADIILLDISSEKFYPYSAIDVGLINTAVGQDVVLTMCNGKILYRNNI
ncbi:MAG: amidohydrolase family protein [Clostridia bacterium]|nr:amidohydrolase family protein [Clostridia bacterium]